MPWGPTGGWGQGGTSAFTGPQPATPIVPNQPQQNPLNAQYGQYFIPGVSAADQIRMLNAGLDAAYRTGGSSSGGYGGRGGGGGGGGGASKAQAQADFAEDFARFQTRTTEDKKTLEEQFRRAQQGYGLQQQDLAQNFLEMLAQAQGARRGLRGDLTARGATTSQGGRQGFQDIARQQLFGTADIGRAGESARLDYENQFINYLKGQQQLQRALEDAFVEGVRLNR